MAKLVSESLSFQGWKFSKWFLGNWSTIKEFLKVGVPWVASTFVTDAGTQQFLITIVGKFLIDTGEYWFKEKNQ